MELMSRRTVNNTARKGAPICALIANVLTVGTIAFGFVNILLALGKVLVMTSWL